MMNLVAAMKAAHPSAAGAVPVELRPYVQGKVLVSSWYPEEHHMELLRILAGWIRQPGKDVWHYLGRKNAQVDLSGIYSAMVLVGRPAATLRRAPRIWRLYRDTGVESVRDIDESAGTARLELRDYPFMGPEMAGLVSGYFEEMLRQAGAEDVTVEVLDDGTGDDDVMKWRVAWC